MRRLAFFFAAALFAQDPIFRIDSKLVVVNVSVKDKAGNPVTNLNKGDFELLEDGLKQSLSVFDLERLSNDALPPVALNAATGTLESRTALANEITAPTLRHDDKRLLALFFDNSSLQQSDQVRAREAAL